MGPDNHRGQGARLVLYPAVTFWARLRGLHGVPVLSEHQGLYMAPCWAVHTFGMRVAIDVVFVDRALNELKRVDALRPNQISVCRNAKAVVELPGGYCRRHRDYLGSIRKALT